MTGRRLTAVNNLRSSSFLRNIISVLLHVYLTKLVLDIEWSNIVNEDSSYCKFFKRGLTAISVIGARSLYLFVSTVAYG